MKTTIYKPAGELRPDVAVVAPFPFNGTPENSSVRMQMVADRIGATVIGAQRFGTGTTVIDLAARKELSPDETIKTHTVIGQKLAQSGILNDYLALVGWGDLGGGAAVMAVQLGANLFDGLLLRNCINLRAIKRPEHPVVGTANFLAYLAVGELRKPVDPDAPQLPWSTDAGGLWDKIRRVRAEMYHYRPLMLSQFTINAVRELAARPDLPIRYVDMMHTFTGNAESATRFALELHQLRADARRKAGQDPSAICTDLQWSIEDWYHSDLLRPDYAARNIEETIDLMSHY